MDACKFCGKPVRFPIQVHAACWEYEINRFAEKFCDEYCKWPEKCAGEEELEAHCDACRLVALSNLGASEKG